MAPLDTEQSLARHHQDIERIPRGLLQNQRDGSAPAAASKLPPEILALIFHEVVELYGASSKASRRREWMVFTFVCRTWREVALHIPDLWDHLILHHRNEEQLSEFLKRSGQVPLVVVQPDIKGLSSELPTEILQLMLSCLYRTADLACLITPKLLEIPGMAALHAPLLQSLDAVVIVPPCETSFPIVSNASWPVLCALNCRTPSVHFLQAMLRPTLTSLTIHHMPIPQPSTIWVPLLQQLPNLEALWLHNAIARRSDVPSARHEPSQTVTLSDLQWLTLEAEGSGTGVAELLRCLVLPNECNMSLEGLYSEEMGDDDIHCVVAALATKGRGIGILGSPQPVHFVCVDFLYVKGESGGFQIRVYTEDISMVETIQAGRYFPPNDIYPHVTLGFYASWDEGSSVLSNFCVSYPLSDTHVFRFHNIFSMNQDALMPVAQTQSVRELDIRYSDDTLLAFLNTLKKPAAFPNLEWVVCRGFKWNRCHTKEIKKDCRAGSFMLQLIEALETRREHGLPAIKTLMLEDGVNLDVHGTLAQDTARLTELVEEFTYTVSDRRDVEYDSSGECSGSDEGLAS